jgi:predicted hydrocarbon binding protein
LKPTSRSYGKDLAEFFINMVGKGFILRNYDYGLNILSAIGWGIPELRFRSEAEFPNMTVKLSSCFECEGRKSNEATCSFVRESLAGVFGEIAGIPVQCEESMCKAKGDTYCKFELQGEHKPLMR